MLRRVLTLMGALLWSLPAAAGIEWAVEHHDGLSAYTATVTSAADGTASSSLGLYGYVVAVDTDPAAAGDAPSDNWGCTLLGPLGADVLGGAASANRDTSNSERTPPIVTLSTVVYPFRAPVFGAHTLSCAAMGDANVATVTLLIEAP